MSERSETISELLSSFDRRTAYIKSKIGVVVPSKIKALRLKSRMFRQSDLASAAKVHQSRISMFETPGAANMTLETLAKLAAAFKVGLVVDFVPFSEMLKWENRFSQDSFNVLRLDEDKEFLREPRKNRESKKRDGAVTFIQNPPLIGPYQYGLFRGGSLAGTQVLSIKGENPKFERLSLGVIAPGRTAEGRGNTYGRT